MNQLDICDKILNYCLTTRKPFHRLEKEKEYAAEGITSNELDFALKFLSAHAPMYLYGSSEIYSLTAEGEAFALNGGYAGRVQREIEEKAVREQERELVRQVDQSLLDTNKFVRETQQYQKRLTRNMFMVAICALMISLGSLAISILNMYINSSEPQVSRPQQELQEDSTQAPTNSPDSEDISSK